MIRGVGATDKATAIRGIKRGRKLSEYELSVIAQLRRPSKQVLANDITTGYQYERAMMLATVAWLEKNG